ncbi:flagellar M-ring protein FliF [Rubrivivax gelatinosus]|nr:flagellar M-ring protein FliF [Rubrivivax gelatinosus]
METAVVPQTPLLPAEPGFAARLSALPMKTKAMAGVGIAALLAIVVVLALSLKQEDYRILFANVGEKDGGAIIEKLAQMNVPYRFSEGGGTIMVPAAQVYDLRLKLSAAGLPKGSINGYELLDKTAFGQTQGQERINLQRALEGELTRTIQSLSSVESARVHLALPNQNGFFREQQKPSASVVLNLRPGHSLDRAQLAGIVHLVSSSVPELSAKAVSVLDGDGTLLSSQDNAAQGLDTQQLQYVREVEATYLRRVNDLLEPVVGRDNLRATVTAEVDFSQTEQTSEEFKPNQGENAAAVRASRVAESNQPGAATATGVPGAVSNQPPVPASAPINGSAQALQAANTGGGANNARRESETRYEVDKTVRVIRGATGSVRRLNAAVVVNHRTGTDAKGKPTSTPLSQEELDKLTALVEQGIGFSKERGDSVRVVNAPFRIEKAPEAEETPLWQQPWALELLRNGATPAALVLVALIVAFTLIRPAIKAATAKPEPVKGETVDELVDGATSLPGIDKLPALEAPRSNEKLEAARNLARQNPAAVANIVRGWVSGEAA